MNTRHPSRLTDAQLLTRVTLLSRCERRATARLIAHLAEFERRSLHLGAGFPSLFVYCTEVLRLSEHEAYNRIEAARAVQRFPVILARLALGCLNLTAVRLLAPHLTEANVTGLIAEAEGKGKSGVLEVLARHFPKPDVPDSIRKVPTARASDVVSLHGRNDEPADPADPADAADPAERGDVNGGTAPSVLDAPPVGGACEAGGACETGPPAALTGLLRPSPRPDTLRPLAENRYEVRFTATRETCEKLKLAKDLLRHRLPNGETAEVIDRALTLLIEDLAQKKFAATSRPRLNAENALETENGTASRNEAATRHSAGAIGAAEPAAITAPASRHIPAQVKRTVWTRDGGRCAFVGQEGRRCTQQGFLEFHHVRPYAVGGRATADNIALRCRAHNAYEAELYYGPGVREGGELVPERVEASRHASLRTAIKSGTKSGTGGAERLHG